MIKIIKSKGVSMIRVLGLLLLFGSWQLASASSALRATRSVVRGAMSKNINQSAHLRGLLEQLRVVRTQSRMSTRNNADGERLVVGIDLGTTNSVVSVFELADGVDPKVLENNGKNVTPSVVQFDAAGNMSKVGDDAVNNSIQAPADTISSAKRLIGAQYKDVISDINTEELPYKVVQGEGGRVAIELSSGKTILPEQVSAEVLANLYSVVKKKYPNHEIEGIVITVPERFTSDPRQATVDAAEIAGFPVAEGKVFLVNEPSAAAISYGVGKDKDDALVIVFDLGGGTSDFALLRVNGNEFDTIATAGDIALGGDNIDEAIVKAALAQVKEKADFELSAESMDMLRTQAIAAKHTLSTSDSAEFTVVAFGEGSAVPVTAQVTLTRADLNLMIDDFVKKSSDMIKELLAKTTPKKLSALNPDEISEIVLVGGTTRIPRFAEALAEIFPNSNLHFGENPDEAISLGAAIFAKSRFTAEGDVSLVQSNNITIGIALKDDVFLPIVEEGAAIPGTYFTKDPLTTTIDNQPSVAMDVYQGSRAKASANKALGKFSVPLDTVRKAGEHSFKVAMHVDSNGILKVEFEDTLSGKKVEHVIEGTSRLNADEIARFQSEGMLNADEDKMFLERIDQKNELAGLIRIGKNMLSNEDFKTKISDSTRAEVEDVIAKAESLAESDGSSIEALVEEYKKLEEILQRMSNEVAPGGKQQ